MSLAGNVSRGLTGLLTSLVLRGVVDCRSTCRGRVVHMPYRGACLPTGPQMAGPGSRVEVWERAWWLLGTQVRPRVYCTYVQMSCRYTAQGWQAFAPGRDRSGHEGTGPGQAQVGRGRVPTRPSRNPLPHQHITYIHTYIHTAGPQEPYHGGLAWPGMACACSSGRPVTGLRLSFAGKQEEGPRRLLSGATAECGGEGTCPQAEVEARVVCSSIRPSRLLVPSPPAFRGTLLGTSFAGRITCSALIICVSHNTHVHGSHGERAAKACTRVWPEYVLRVLRSHAYKYVCTCVHPYRPD